MAVKSTIGPDNYVISEQDRIYIFYTLSRGSHEALEGTLQYIQENFVMLQDVLLEEGLIAVFTDIHLFLHTQAQIDIMKAIFGMTSNMSGQMRDILFFETANGEYYLDRNNLQEQFFNWSGDVKPEVPKPEPEGPEPDAANSMKGISLIILLVFMAFVHILL